MKSGSLNIKNVFKGSTPIQKVMKGATLVWENWKAMTGEIFKYSGTLSTSDSDSSGQTTKATSIIKFEKVTRNLKGTMDIKGSGGEEDAQYGYGVRFYTNSALTEYIETSNAHLVRGTAVQRKETVSFQSQADVAIYGVAYVVWTWNGGSSTSYCDCTGARVTSWQQKG